MGAGLGASPCPHFPVMHLREAQGFQRAQLEAPSSVCTPTWGKGRADASGEQSRRDHSGWDQGNTDAYMAGGPQGNHAGCTLGNNTLHFKHVGCLNFLELSQRMSSLSPRFHLTHLALICLHPLPVLIEILLFPPD